MTTLNNKTSINNLLKENGFRRQPKLGKGLILVTGSENEYTVTDAASKATSKRFWEMRGKLIELKTLDMPDFPSSEYSFKIYGETKKYYNVIKLSVSSFHQSFHGGYETTKVLQATFVQVDKETLNIKY